MQINNSKIKIRFSLKCFGVLLLTSFLFACTSTKQAIEPVANLSVHAGFSSNIIYGEVDGHELKLDMIIPRINLGEAPWWRKYDNKLKPVLLYIHGGGWVEGEKETRLLGQLPFVSKGWVLVNMDYRLAHHAKAPAAVADCRMALDWIYKNAQKYQIDTNRIVVAGESAGGHLALMTGMLKKGDSLCGGKYIEGSDNKVAAIINWFGATDFSLRKGMEKHPWFDQRDDWSEAIKSLSPVNYVSKNNPPILTIHGDADPVVLPEHAHVLHQKLNEAGAKNKKIIIPGKKHGNFSGEERTRIFEEIWKFLEGTGINTTNE